MIAKKKTKKKASLKKKVIKKKVAKKKVARKKIGKKKVLKKASVKKKAPARKKISKKKLTKKKVTKKKVARKKIGKKKVLKKASVKKKAPARKKISKKKLTKKKVAKKAIAKISTRKKTTKKKSKRITKVTKIDIATSNKATRKIKGAPYKKKKGENFMSAEQTEHFRAILNAWKRELMEEVDRTVHHMQDEASNFPDPIDRATQEEEFALELRTRDRERKLIRKIDEAIMALDSGDYGYCEICGIEIDARRLEARPTATLCIDCKTLDEIKERQLG